MAGKRKVTIWKYPESPEELPTELYNIAYPVEKPVPYPYDKRRLMQFRNFLPCRKSKQGFMRAPSPPDRGQVKRSKTGEDINIDIMYENIRPPRNMLADRTTPLPCATSGMVSVPHASSMVPSSLQLVASSTRPTNLPPATPAALSGGISTSTTVETPSTTVETPKPTVAVNNEAKNEVKPKTNVKVGPPKPKSIQDIVAAVAEASISKKPAAATETTMKRPAAAKQDDEPVLKKPAGAIKAVGKLADIAMPSTKKRFEPIQVGGATIYYCKDAFRVKEEAGSRQTRKFYFATLGRDEAWNNALKLARKSM